jgi:hypothetical protein
MMLSTDHRTDGNTIHIKYEYNVDLLSLLKGGEWVSIWPMAAIITFHQLHSL